MISIVDITKTYEKGKITALSSINLTVNQGELFGLIGPDGAGKTSLIRIIASLLKPDAGSVSVFEYDTQKEYQQVRNSIGYMPGRFSLYQDLSVEENLNFFANVFRVDVEQNYHLISELYDQLAPFKDRRAGKLSGGMKQKLALCCALIHEPRLLLLDEPTTGVDPVSRNEFWYMLLKLKKRGITILVSTPYMDEASLCDRVALMQSGTILDQGTPSDICKQSGLVLYSIDSNQSFHLMQAIKEYTNTNTCYAFGSSLHINLKDNEIEGLMSYLSAKGFSGLDYIMIDPGIEDVFMEKLNQVA